MITEDEVVRVAYLARLSLNEKEISAMAEQLSFVLKHFEQVAKVETKGVEPLVTPTPIEAHWRQDQVVQQEVWQGAESAMANAPETMGNLFKVPPVVS